MNLLVGNQLSQAFKSRFSDNRASYPFILVNRINLLLSNQVLCRNSPRFLCLPINKGIWIGYLKNTLFEEKFLKFYNFTTFINLGLGKYVPCGSFRLYRGYQNDKRITPKLYWYNQARWSTISFSEFSKRSSFAKFRICYES